MRELYFNILNGECVPAFTCLPVYRATITGSKIHKIEASFNVRNISSKGYEWFISEVEDENTSWTHTHPHLMKSLKKLALKQSLKYPFKHSNFEPNNHRFPFITFWVQGKKFTEAHFINK